MHLPLAQPACCTQYVSTSPACFCPAQTIQEQPSGAAQLRALSDALRQSLAEWFSVGLLQLQRISWEGSSAALLEKASTLLALLACRLCGCGCHRGVALCPGLGTACAGFSSSACAGFPSSACTLPPCHLPPPSALQVAAGEAVHDFVSWGDLKGRLNPDNRRCVPCRMH